jgi:hypothetical protein
MEASGCWTGDVAVGREPRLASRHAATDGRNSLPGGSWRALTRRHRAASAGSYGHARHPVDRC